MIGTRAILTVLMAGILVLTTTSSPFARQDEPDHDKDPVLFVHGHSSDDRRWTGGPQNWDGFFNYFHDQGNYPDGYLYTVDVRGMGNIEAAALIGTKVDEILATHGKDKVDIVCHSMGCLSSRYYVAVLHPEKVDTWLGLAGVNHGSDESCGFGCGDDAGMEEMCPAFASEAGDSRCKRWRSNSTIQYLLNGVGTDRCDVDETPYSPADDNVDAGSTLWNKGDYDIRFPWGSVCDDSNRVPPEEDKRVLYYTIRPRGDILGAHDTRFIVGAGGDRQITPGDSVVEERPGQFFIKDWRLGFSPIGHFAILQNATAQELAVELLHP